MHRLPITEGLRYIPRESWYRSRGQKSMDTPLRISKALDPKADPVMAAIDELSAMMDSDGGALVLSARDIDAGKVALQLKLDSVECADCVMPPDHLYEVVWARLRAADSRLQTLSIADPRVNARSLPASDDRPVIAVLDPTSSASPANEDPGPNLGSLVGKRIGLRIDVLWAAYDYTVDEWIPMFEGLGATVATWRRAQGLKGEEGEAHQAEYDAFVGGVDAIVSGLANCGSCTSWSVKDGLNALNRGLPAAVAVTEHFVPLARTLATDAGRGGLRLIELDASLNVLDEHTVRERARAAFPTLLASMGAQVS